MYPQSPDPHERLNLATEALRETTIRDDVLVRGQRAIMTKMPATQARFNSRIAWATGTCIVACGAIAFLAPSRSYASELLKIARVGDAGMRHIRVYSSENGAPYQMAFDYYAYDGQQKLTDQFGNQILVKPDGAIQLHADGSAEFQRTNGHPREWFTSSLDELVTKNLGTPGLKVAVDRGTDWNGRTVDRFTIDQDFIDGRRESNHAHAELIADPLTKRPLEMDTTLASGQRSVQKWDYPSPDLSVFTLAKLDKNRVYDLDAERNEIRNALAGSGVKAMVAGHTVELMQLWIDEHGNAAAIARADYAYSDNFVVHIDGKPVSTEPESDEFPTRYRVHPPTSLDGRSVQAFFGFRTNSGEPHLPPDRVSLLEIPVFEGQKLAGYAKFANVPVHRTWQVGYLIQPENLPFWSPQPKGVGAAAAEAKPVQP